jgi:hypothetical protein
MAREEDTQQPQEKRDKHFSVEKAKMCLTPLKKMGYYGKMEIFLLNGKKNSHGVRWVKN